MQTIITWGEAMIKLPPYRETFGNQKNLNSLSTDVSNLVDQSSVKRIALNQLEKAIQHVRIKLITIKRLNTSALITEACALLHEVYIQQQEWQFSADNPSKLRVEIRNNKRVLLDRLTDSAIWFGAFDNEKLVGCFRLHSIDDNHQLEVETYPSSYPIWPYIPSGEKERCYEITRIAIKENYAGKGVVKRLLLTCFRFCQEKQSHVFVNTHNGYLKSLFKKISFPMKKEYAFKYEPQDISAVSLFFANYKKLEVDETLKKLEYLEDDLSNNATSIFKALQTVESILPTPFYWMNAQGVVLGINELMLKDMGTTHEIIGKKPYAFYKPEIAEHILSHNAEVIRKEAILAQEEWIEDVTTKERKCFSSIKAPLYDDEGAILGIVGTSIEITAQKETELLKLENERQQVVLQEQDKFAHLARKVVHDINSPLAALKMMIPLCHELPEAKRTLLVKATQGIFDIANNLLNSYNGEKKSTQLDVEPRQPLLISDLLNHLLSEKKLEYQDRPVMLDFAIDDDAQFAFIHMQPVEFKRSMSNLINNAVDAIEGQTSGAVTMHLTATKDTVEVEIKDNGKGMPPEMIGKIQDHQSFTEGKENGHGIGLQQVWDTLKNNQGALKIRSSVGEGTSFLLSFPRIAAADWIAQEVHLTEDNIIVILDDDESIHTAWNLRFKPFLKSYPALQIQHFTQGQKALDFLNSLGQEEKNRVVFLSDYELLNQNRNGLQIVEASEIKHAMLVTSYYSDSKVRKEIERLMIKVLPKQMASVIPIYFD